MTPISAINLQRRYTSDVAGVLEDEYEVERPMRTKPKTNQTQAQEDIRRATADYTMQKSRIPVRNTASNPGNHNTSGRQTREYYERKTERLPKQRRYLLTRISTAKVTISIGIGLLSILASWIGVTNVEAWYGNNQDMSYYSQLTHRDYVEVGNTKEWAILDGNQVDLIIIKNDNAKKSIILEGPKLKGDMTKVRLEVIRNYDEVITVHARSERVAGLTFNANQDDIHWSVDLSKSENGGAK